MNERIETFDELRAAVTRAGCFTHRPTVAVLSLAAHVVASALLFAASACAHSPAGVALFVLASLVVYRIGWLMHDAAHGAVFARAERNRAWAAVTAGVLGEFASGWRYGHNRHHAAPNVRGRDMDQSERWDPARRYHTKLGAFIGLFLFSRVGGRYLPKTLLLLGLRDGYFCFKHHRDRFAGELAGVLAGLALQLAHFAWCFGGWAPLALFAHTVIGMIYLNTVFAGNHYDLESFTEAEARGLHFADLQLRTTRNYRGGALARFAFGGLEHQIEHHLFPSMPRHALQHAAPYVRTFCATRALPYHEAKFTDAIAAALRFHLDA